MENIETTTLYRPTGKNELALIEASGYTKFPPRLLGQPIFYPVLNDEYATQIARDWNAKYNADKLGYVTKFEVRSDYLADFEIQVVGSSVCQEYWIPAEDVERFNENIVGNIEVISTFDGNSAS
jgi:hypothetical protein